MHKNEFQMTVYRLYLLCLQTTKKCFPKASFLGHSTERQSIVNHYTVNPITKATTSVVVFMENALFNSELWKMQVELKYIFGSRNLQL